MKTCGVSLWRSIVSHNLWVDITVRWCLAPVLAVLACVALTGCTDQMCLPSTEQLAEFESAGPDGPAVDLDRLTKARLDTGPYIIKPGEVLELSMPTILQIVTAEEPRVTDKTSPYICRVSQEGMIALPIVGEITAAGRSADEVEAAIVQAYYPQFTPTRPSVYVRILEYRTHRVSIVGAVLKPGLYDLRADKMSLVALLMEAGGITEQGAAVIRVTHDGRPAAEPGSNPPVRETSGVPREDQPFSASAHLSTGPFPVKNREEQPAQHRSPSLQVRFERDSLLDTAGLIAIGRAGGPVVVSKWLDLGSEQQRDALVNGLGGNWSESVTAELRAKLLELGLLLQLTSTGAIKEIRPRNWQTAEGTSFATSLGESSQARATMPDGLGSRRSGIQTPAMLGAAFSRKEEISATVFLPVKGLNIPFADVPLREGDAVVVEPLVMSFVSVLGLVSRPGNFEYPPGVTYNLGQVIALAGGLDQVADPRYATVYRLKSDGTVARAVFTLYGGKHKNEMTDALSVPIKRGDIVAVEQTPRTRSNLFLDRIVRVNIGTYVSTQDLWD